MLKKMYRVEINYKSGRQVVVETDHFSTKFNDQGELIHIKFNYILDNKKRMLFAGILNIESIWATEI